MNGKSRSAMVKGQSAITSLKNIDRILADDSLAKGKY